MKKSSDFVLSLAVTLVYLLIAGYYLVPGVYHPFSSDTVLHTTPHLTLSAIFAALAILTLIMGRLARSREP